MARTRNGFNRCGQSQPAAFPALERYSAQVLSDCGPKLRIMSDSFCSTLKSLAGARLGQMLVAGCPILAVILNDYRQPRRTMGAESLP